MSSHKTAFADRLSMALDHAGFPRRGKGQQTAVAKAFGVNQASVSQWLRGDNLPDVERVHGIAKYLETNVAWLLYGTGEPYIQNSIQNRKEKSTGMKVPILSFEEAARWQTAVNKARTKKAFVMANIPLGSKAYSLVVKDDSLLPIYREGTLLIIDPAAIPKHKDHVLYAPKNEKEAVCKELVIEGKSKYLIRFSSGFPAYFISNRDKFCGVVRQIQFTFR